MRDIWALIDRYVPARYRWIVPFVFLIFYGYTYYYEKLTYQANYHAEAESVRNHHADEVIYKDGYVKVHWAKLPKTVNCAFTETWMIFIPQRGWIEVHQWSYNKDAVPPYQKEGADVLKPVTFWGDDVFVGNLEPGRYEIRIKYKYDCWNWGVNEWEPDESIQFTVE